jgi:DUF971 family protein
MTEPGEHAAPQAVVDHRASGVLELLWPDGSTSRLPHGLLRQRCRCAGCEQQRRQGRAQPAVPDLRIAEIRPVADKALNIVFSDGHGRGIFPWAYLRQVAADGAAEAAVESAPA